MGLGPRSKYVSICSGSLPQALRNPPLSSKRDGNGIFWSRPIQFFVLQGTMKRVWNVGIGYSGEYAESMRIQEEDWERTVVELTTQGL